MKPYNKEYILNIIEEYNNAIESGNKGIYKIDKKVLKREDIRGYMYENKEDYDVEIIELIKEKNSLMRLDPREIESAYEAIRIANGRVGVVGLGIGYVAQEMAKKNNVDEVIVYEISEDVIELYKNNFDENAKIKIIQGDAFRAQKEKFDFFYVDIYEYSLTSKVVEDYKKFNKMHEIEEYSFWGMEHFMLSCNYQDILWVYIPENWVSMCKNLYTKLQSSGYIKTYKPLNEEKVTKILYEFKEILNSEM